MFMLKIRMVKLNVWLYWVYLKCIVVMSYKSLEKCELWVLLLDLELEIWIERLFKV